MAKPSTDFERQYRSEVKRIKRSIKGLEERGYVVHYDIPELPKSWRGKFLKELHEVNRSELLRKSTYFDPYNDKWVKGTEGRVIENKVKSEKAKLTREIRKSNPDYKPPKSKSRTSKRATYYAVQDYKTATNLADEYDARDRLSQRIALEYETAIRLQRDMAHDAVLSGEIPWSIYDELDDSLMKQHREVKTTRESYDFTYESDDEYDDFYYDDYSSEPAPVETPKEVSDVQKYGEPELPPELPPLTPEDYIDTGIDFVGINEPEPEQDEEPRIETYETYDQYYEMWRYDTINEDTGELIQQQWVSEDGEIFEDPRDYIPFEQQMFTQFRHGYEHYNEQFVHLLDTALNNARQKVGLNSLMDAIQSMKNTGEAPSFDMAYNEGAVREYLTELGEYLDIDDFGVEGLLDAYEADMSSDSYSI